MSARAIVSTNPSAAVRSVSPTLYGLFYEDLNRAADGGLNANVLANHSFDGIYLDRRLHNELIATTTKRRPRITHDRTRHWDVQAGSLEALTGGGPTPASTYARLATAGGRAVVVNGGYQRAGARLEPCIAVRVGTDMLFTAWVAAAAFDGAAVVRLIDGDGRTVGEAALDLGRGDQWHRVAAVVPVTGTGRVRFELRLEGSGRLDVDELSLVPVDHWGAGDPRWSQGLLRRDLVEALARLQPRFMRFPGGCVVEGISGDNAYDWKRTVGPLHERTADYNLWGLRVPDGDYSQSNQIGSYEFFLLCEDLGMAAMPIVPAGISCQFRSKECIRHDDHDFARVVQDVLDLVEWATGDPDESRWAALRAEAGHPEPFELRYLGIGNENHGDDYLRNFAAIRDAVRAAHPEITPVLSAGPFAQGKAFDAAWELADAGADDVIVDEHFYKAPSWFIGHTTRYDDYPRDRKVFVGEYAARSIVGRDAPNTFASALAEAAMLTGVERNADVVVMTSYAPLLNNVGARLWPHNLIDFNPEAVLPTVNFEVQRLFATTIGDTIVPVEADLPAGVFASSTATGAHQNVKLVNATDDPVEVELRPGQVSDARCEITTLAAGLAASTELEFVGTGRRALAPAVTTAEVVDGRVLLELGARSVTSVDLPSAVR